MTLLETLVRQFAPHSCIGCGTEEDCLLCIGCVQSLALVPSRCYNCQAVTDDYAVCKDCASRTALRQVLVFAHYQGLAKELVHRTKYERARAGAIEMAALMAEQLVYLPEDVILTHIPTATSRVRSRGYDQAHLIARAVARQSALPYQALLRRSGQAHQVGANRAARLRQLHQAFRPVHISDIRGKHIVLVDDVLTTGATLETAARVLRRAGAARVSALVFAQA